jgi:hypothetical protein
MADDSFPLRLLSDFAAVAAERIERMIPTDQLIEGARKQPVEAEYKKRADEALRQLCSEHERGAIFWLQRNWPLLYETLTRDLPDRISDLWNAHASLSDFDAVLRDLLETHRQAVALFRAHGK